MAGGFNSDTQVSWEAARDAYTSTRDQGHSILVPVEAYLTRINKIDLRMSKAGNPYLNLEYRIVSSITRQEDPDLGDPEEFANMPLFGMAMLSHDKPNVMATLRSLEAAVGFDPETDGNLDDFVAALKDSNVRVTTKLKQQDDYPDKVEIGRILPASDEDAALAAGAEDDDDPFA